MFGERFRVYECAIKEKPVYLFIWLEYEICSYGILICTKSKSAKTEYDTEFVTRVIPYFILFDFGAILKRAGINRRENLFLLNE